MFRPPEKPAEFRSNVASLLLERIRELLFDMPAPGNDDHPVHWGHVGDINHVNAMLAEAMTFLDRSGK